MEIDLDANRAGLLYSSLMKKFEEKINDVLTTNFPRYWRENSLSENILKALLDPSNSLSRNNLTPSIKIRWDAYKFEGKIEQQHGDIAVIVVREVKGSKPLTGVGFLEAKKRIRGKSNYSSIKTTQLERILKNTPRAYVLLYDYEVKIVKVPLFEPTLHLGEVLHHLVKLSKTSSIDKRGSLDEDWQTRAFAVPANLVLALNTKKSHLVEYGLPLSYVLCFRFFQGYDLDFDNEIVQKVRYRTQEFEDINYILVVAIGEVADDQIPQPAAEMFSRLE